MTKILSENFPPNKTYLQLISRKEGIKDKQKKVDLLQRQIFIILFPITQIWQIYFAFAFISNAEKFYEFMSALKLFNEEWKGSFW